MNLLSARGVEVAFGDRAVLRGADLAVAAGDRVGLVGANGSGKSTLLRVLGGAIAADHGTVERAARVAYLDQDPELPGETVAACAEAAIAWHRELLVDYQRKAGTVAGAALHDQLDLVGWEVEHRVDAMLDRLGAPTRTARSADLSGGERRRVALALALLGSPEVLLLDEPTNHLDADAVEWLQAWLVGYRGALVLVTHDRYLLEAVAERIVEMEAGLCVSYEGSYGDYLVARAERQASLQKAEDKRLELIAREAAWAARSPAARSTKQKARLQRLDALEAQGRVHLEQSFDLDLRTGNKAGGIVLEIHGLRKAYDGRELFGGLELALSAGERIGVLGPNGCGKSTLLRILGGTEPPDRGEIVRGARINIAVMDQARSGLDDESSVLEAAGGGSSHVFVGEVGPARWQTDSKKGGSKAVHVASYLERFLFPREMHDQPVNTLSGGERARLLLARLLLAGANVLLLDEPTNDLDLSTLRVLEDALLSYDGAVVVVTHDRAFLDRVCTSVLAFEGDRVVRYASRLQHLRAMRELESAKATEDRVKVADTPKARSSSPRMSWREQRELEALPGRIEALETEQAALAATLADPETYRSRGDEIAALQGRTATIESEIEGLFARWGELEGR